nr:zinc finger, CCHC-type, retrotransposon Gag domain protein [Tanacetum cinerariifolium]
RFFRLAGFLGAAAGTEEEQAKNFQWGLSSNNNYSGNNNRLNFKSFQSPSTHEHDPNTTNALQTLLPQICKEIREEFRTGSGSSNAGGNPTPVTIHTWLERFNKQKPHSFEKATAPVDAENWISYMEKIFDVMGCEDEFKTRLAIYKFEGNALAWW